MTIKHSDRYSATGSSNTVPEAQENARSLLNTDVTFTVGSDPEDDYANFLEALAGISDNYEINNTVTLILNSAGDILVSAQLPMFFGKGTFIIEGNNSTLTFIDEPTSLLEIRNYTAVNLVFQNMNLSPGTSNATLTVEGQNISFNNLDFGGVKPIFTSCNNLSLTDCDSSQPQKFYKTSVNMLRGVSKIEFYNCITEVKNVEINAPLIVKGGSFLMDNPKFNFNYWINSCTIQNASVDLTGWITCVNLGGATVSKNLISIEASSINRLPFNIQVQGNNYTFDGVYILKLVNCGTPATFPSVNYDFSAHSFINNGAAIGLFSSNILPGIPGAVIYKDPLSIYDGNNFDNTGTTLTSTNLQDAVIELYNLINP